MARLTKWEKTLLSTIMSAYQSADYNCGASDREMKLANCPKLGNSDIHLCMPCGNCKYSERFEKLMEKIAP